MRQPIWSLMGRILGLVRRGCQPRMWARIPSKLHRSDSASCLQARSCPNLLRVPLGTACYRRDRAKTRPGLYCTNIQHAAWHVGCLCKKISERGGSGSINMPFLTELNLPSPLVDLAAAPLAGVSTPQRLPNTRGQTNSRK